MSKRVSVDLDEEVWKELKRLQFEKEMEKEERVSLNILIKQAVDLYLEQNKKAAQK